MVSLGILPRLVVGSPGRRILVLSVSLLSALWISVLWCDRLARFILLDHIKKFGRQTHRWRDPAGIRRPHDVADSRWHAGNRDRSGCRTKSIHRRQPDTLDAYGNETNRGKSVIGIDAPNAFIADPTAIR